MAKWDDNYVYCVARFDEGLDKNVPVNDRKVFCLADAKTLLADYEAEYAHGVGECPPDGEFFILSKPEEIK